MAPAPKPLVHRLPVVRHVFLRPHLTAATVLGILVYLTGMPQDEGSTRILIAWDAGLLLYLALSFLMMRDADQSKIKKRAELLDEGRVVTLLLSTLAVVASMAAIFAALGDAKELAGEDRAWHVALAGVTVCLSWAFLHIVYAQHYAHAYYSNDHGKPREGLDFPGKGEPNYWDFVYFAGIIGMTAQTADVDITSTDMRRIALAHCVLSFFFNIVVLALTVNSSASLFT